MMIRLISGLSQGHLLVMHCIGVNLEIVDYYIEYTDNSKKEGTVEFGL